MDLSTISLTSWAGLTAAAALVGGFWRQAVGILKRAMDLFICRVIVKDEAARAVMSHAWRHGRRSPFGLRLFGGINSFVAPKKRVEIVAYEGVTSEPLLFWLGRVPVILGSGRSQKSNESGANVGYQSGSAMPVSLWYLRGTINIDDLVVQALTEHNTLRQNREAAKKSGGPKRFNVFKMHGTGGYGQEKAKNDSSYGALVPSNNGLEEVVQQIHHGEIRLLTWKPEELVERSSDVPPFVNHPVSAEIMGQFNEIATWLSHENWFRSKGVPWRKGYLIHGPGGGGKTTLIRNIAIQYDLPIYTFDLSSYDNRSFETDWKTAQQNAPSIILLEDIDCTFRQRTNLTTEGKNRDGLTFDCLLNTISGVGSSDGVLLFVTTNKIESLDSALGIPADGSTKSTRPGRIDKAIYMGPMGEPERQQLAQMILADWPWVIDQVVKEGEGEMAAQFQNRCAQLAETMFWQEHKASYPVREPVDRQGIAPRSLDRTGSNPLSPNVEALS